jgi:hypothetical protein
VNYQLISIVAVLALLLIAGMVLIADAGVRALSKHLNQLARSNGLNARSRRDFLTQYGAGKARPVSPRGIYLQE